MPLPTMTVSKPQWREFCRRLGGPEGCNFQKSAAGKLTWKCDSKGLPIATGILNKMCFDIESSLAYFRKHGGFCDCEVLFNVERSARHLDRRPRRPARKIAGPTRGNRTRT